MKKILVVGAGLSGLTLAWRLRKKGYDVTILEADAKAGGRIQTIQLNGKTPVEMGATWFGEKHVNLLSLLGELGIGKFQQYGSGIALFESMSFVPAQHFDIPPAEEPTYRVQGGSSTIIHTLLEKTGKEHLHLNTAINKVEERGDHILVTDNHHREWQADSVVLTIPPRLLINSVAFTPELPRQLSVIMQSTHTWMSESVKFALSFESPFWRNKGYSGTVYSQAGPVVEMYDHCNAEEDAFALKGFLSGSVQHLDETERKQQVMAQLTKLFGDNTPVDGIYTDRIWGRENFIHYPYEGYILPHQHNGHPVYRQAYMNGKLWIAGTETAPAFPGYMDGAVAAANFVAKQFGEISS